MSAVTLLSLAIASLVAGAGLLLVIAEHRWRVATRRAVAALLSAPSSSPSPGAGGEASAALPAPVGRYLARAVPAGTPPIATVRVEQEGEFRLGDAWRPFRASQWFTIDPPGFVWDARVRLAPGLYVRVRDGYVGGRGFMRAALSGVVTVARADGGAEMGQGSLQRWLAETMWFPQALARGRRCEWAPIDDRGARATLADGTVVATIEFHFTAEGDIERVFTPARPREEHGRFVTMPWGGRVLAWQEHEGVRYVSAVEVGWYEGGTFAPFYRGRVTGVSYSPAPR